MKKLKPVLLVLGPLVLAVGLYYTFFTGPPNPIASEVVFVNVLTGETRKFSQKDVYAIPMLTDDDKPYLFPIDKTPDGGWVIADRYRDALRNSVNSKIISKEGLKVDLGSFKVQAAAN